MIRPVAPRSPEHVLLGFLYERRDYGYALHQRLVRELGQIWRVSQSQSYAILKRLQSQGYASATTLEQEKLPPRQVLRITASGRRRFEEWLQAPSGHSVRAMRLDFLTRLYFARKLFPDMIPGMIEGQLAQIDAALAQLEASGTALPADQIFNRLGLDLRIEQLRSVRDWLTRCREALESMAPRRTP